VLGEQHESLHLCAPEPCGQTRQAQNNAWAGNRARMDIAPAVRAATPGLFVFNKEMMLQSKGNTRLTPPERGKPARLRISLRLLRLPL
jgi:hypothetical protein